MAQPFLPLALALNGLSFAKNSVLSDKLPFYPGFAQISENNRACSKVGP